MFWPREMWLDLITFKPVERPMFVELFGPLIGLPEEWKAQGATPAELSLQAFDFDYTKWTWVGQAGAMGLPETVLLEETTDFRIERDGLGRTQKLDKRTATLPLPMDFPVKSMDDWLRLKPHFVWDEGRVSADHLQQVKKDQAAGAVTVLSIPGAFDSLRNLMGEEVACMAYYDQPELIADILATHQVTAVELAGRVADVVTIDRLFVHEDLAGRSGPLVGPSQVTEWFKPFFSAVWDVVKASGGRVFEMDTDGNVDAVLPAFLDCGLNAIYPMEPAAGMDMVATRETYGDRLALRGGIDKFVLSKGEDAIRAELAYKMQPTMQAGGTVFGMDHRIPNGTPLAGYRFYVETAREMLGLPPLETIPLAERNWARSA